MSNPARVHPDLYWSLPRPHELIGKLAARVRDRRVTMIHHPDPPMPGLWKAVSSALHQALFEPSAIVELRVTGGMDIAEAIRIHLKIGAMSVSGLAKLALPTPMVVVLQAVTAEDRERCEQFVKEFIEATAPADGNIHVVSRAPSDLPARDAAAPIWQIFAFDGGLSPDEMLAYVTTRMIGRPGPGSTRLLAALVREFAGCDARLAEQLIALSDPDILALPEPMIRLLDEDAGRWSVASWSNGTKWVIGDAEYVHPLHELFVANHEGPRRNAMIKALARRGWRASAVALLPWLEEIRQIVLEILKPSLEFFFNEDPRRAQKLIGMGERQRIIIQDVEELELGNILGLQRHHQYKAPPDVLSQAALSVVVSAKPVRDDLAHFRRPQQDRVSDLISKSDSLRTLWSRAQVS